MNRPDLQIRAFRTESFADRVGMHIFTKDRQGRVEVVKHLVMDAVDVHRHVEPTLDIDMHAAQELMDQLWHCGLRPSEGSGSAGAMAATQKHLEDMRKIAFTYLEPSIGPVREP